MPRQVQVTVSIEIPEGTTRLEDLEELVAGAVRRAGRQLLEAAVPLIEPEVLEAKAGARQRKAARYVLTRFGEIRYERWKVKVDGGYTYPLDRALGLDHHATIAPGLLAELVWLAQAMPYRQAAESASRLLGFPVCHRRLWRAAQKAGVRLREEMEAKRAALFEWGELPDPGGPHAMVVMEADGTMLRSQTIRDPAGRIAPGPMEAKLAVFYAGKRVRRSGAGRRRRRAFLQHKGAYATLQGAGRFAQTAFVSCEQALGLTRARFKLFVSDGGGWLPGANAEWIKIPAHQLDHFHGRRRCLATPGLPREVAERLWEHTLSGEVDRVTASLGARVRTGQLEEDEARNLLDSCVTTSRGCTRPPSSKDREHRRSCAFVALEAWSTTST